MTKVILQWARMKLKCGFLNFKDSKASFTRSVNPMAIVAKWPAGVQVGEALVCDGEVERQ